MMPPIIAMTPYTSKAIVLGEKFIFVCRVLKTRRIKNTIDHASEQYF
jgi:hypothetical protein